MTDKTDKQRIDDFIQMIDSEFASDDLNVQFNLGLIREIIKIKTQKLLKELNRRGEL